MKTQEIVEQMNLISEKQAEVFRAKLEETLLATAMTGVEFKQFAPQNVRCPKCSDWKVGKGTYFPGKQANARDDCTYCNGSGIMPIPLSEFDE